MVTKKNTKTPTKKAPLKRGGADLRKVMGIKKNIKDFDDIVEFGLSSKNREKRLMNFLKKTYSDENFEFIIEVKKFEKNPTMGNFNKIYDVYLSNNSLRQVNIPSKIQKVLDAINKLPYPSSHKIQKDVFDAAVTNITRLINSNSKDKFIEEELKRKS